MKNLIDFGNKYAENSDWTDFALTKLCLGSMGVLIGTEIMDDKCRKITHIAAGAVFAATLVPLVARSVLVLMDNEE